MTDINEYLDEIDEIFDIFEVDTNIDERIRYTVYAVSSQMGYEVMLEDYDTG